MFDVLKAQRKGDRLMKKTSTVQALKSKLFKEQKLTIGLDLGDCWSFYCVLDEAGKIILEQKVPTTPEARCTNHCAIATKRCAPWPRVKSSPQKRGC